jgi:hypothetical protein
MSTSPESPNESPPGDNWSTTAIAPDAPDAPKFRPECTFCLDMQEALSGVEEWPPKRNLDIPCHGWPQLASFMVKNPSLESFQSFRDLHIKSLLYYQAELVKIREDLHKLEWEDHSDGTLKYSEMMSRRVDFLFRSEKEFAPGEEGGKQMLKIREMRKMLKEYSKSVFHFLVTLLVRPY